MGHVVKAGFALFLEGATIAMVPTSETTVERCDAEEGEPSLQQIKELTAEIRRHWSPKEHRLRARIGRVTLLEIAHEPRRNRGGVKRPI
jgi:hypothetical protein